MWKYQNLYDLDNYWKPVCKYKNTLKCKPEFLSYLMPKMHFYYTWILEKKKKTCPTTQQFLDYTGKEVFLFFKNLWKVKKAHGQLL